MKLSIIIPTYNEESSISGLVKRLLAFGNDNLLEIIVVDGGSTDQTCDLAKNAGALVYKSPQQGRAAQMNFGAHKSSGDVLYFVHADSVPPKSYLNDIEKALNEGYDMGCYRFKFDSNSWLLKVNSYFTRFDRLMCRGGDQTLFITKHVFTSLNGFKQDYLIMEEYDLFRRTKGKFRFKIIPKDVIVSARKYENNSYFRVNIANFIVFMQFFAGSSQAKMVRTYKTLIKHPKG